MNVATTATREALAFPSVAWFERLASIMNANRARQEQLGYVDCIAGIAVLDGGPGGARWDVRVTFEEFSVIDVRASDATADADFVLEANTATWREMIQNIAAGGGRPDLDHSLNRLSHFGTPMAVVSDDPLRRDTYFRFNQSLQEFFNASSQIPTEFSNES
jgi:hypothetical protein